MSESLVEQRFIRRVTADDTVEGHDVSRRQMIGKLEQVAVNDIDRRPTCAADRLVPSRGDIRARCFEHCRALHASVQELESQRADAAADVQQRSVRQPRLREAIAETPRRWADAAAAIRCQFLGGFSRGELPVRRARELTARTRHGSECHNTIVVDHQLRVALRIDELRILASEIGFGDPTGLRAAPSNVDANALFDRELHQVFQRRSAKPIIASRTSFFRTNGASTINAMLT